MSEAIIIDNEWPATIPIPYVDFSGSPRNRTIVGDPSAGRVNRRSRMQTGYSSLSVTWKLTEAQFELFKSFFTDDLEMGCAQFKIELRFPRHTTLTEWIARFIDGFEASPIGDDGNWEVTASLDLVFLAVVSDASPLEGYSPFYVDVSGAGTGDDVPFYTSEGFAFYVQDE